MPIRELPSVDEMYAAFQNRDEAYEGIFFTGVRTTGIFCRPTCPARKAARDNVEFFSSSREALSHGYRPCRRCRPMQPRGRTPESIQALLDELDDDPSRRLRDSDLRIRNVDPAFVRRWFKKHHGITFHAFQRGRRLARALHQLSEGSDVTATAFDNGFDSISGFQEALRQVTGRSASASRGARVVYLSRILTPLGPMLAGAADEGICLLEFTDRRMLPTQIERLERRLECSFLPGTNEFSAQLDEELRLYFEGALREFQTPLMVAGTSFQKRVWECLRTIPYGQVRSYAEQAAAIGDPRAVRAVARANGDNRIAVLIPCHRVVGSDGSLTGYGGGLWRKKFLLDLERGRQADLFETNGVAAAVSGSS